MRFAKSIFIVFLIVALVGCSSGGGETTASGEKENETKVQGGELRVAFPAQPAVLDLHVSNAIATTDIMLHVFESLLTVDADYNIQPMLAESYEQSDDGKTITFYLRKGVHFHNGKEMTAEDVVASLNRWKDGVGARGQFDEAIFEAEDDYTVVLKLPEPLSTALATLSHGGTAFAAIMPKEVIENAGDTGVDEYIGTGPYQFVEWKQDQHIHLAKYEDYQPLSEEPSGLAGSKEALVDDLYFIFTPDTSTMVAGIQSGEYDIAFGVPYDMAEQLESDSEIVLTTFPNAFMTIHFNKRKGLFTDGKARQAVAAALDMEEIMIATFSKDSYYDLSPNMMMYHQKGQWDSDAGEEKYNQKDTEKAKQLLKEAGYDGEEITLITTRDYEDHYDAAVVVQEQLSQIGMNINLEVYDWSAYSEQREDENSFDMFMLGLVPVPEPTSNVYFMKDYGGWTDSQELDEVIEEFRRQPTLDDAKMLYDNLQEAYWDYLPIVKIGDYDKIIALRDTVENFEEQNQNHRMILWNISINN